jgi:hypothetical protein
MKPLLLIAIAALACTVSSMAQNVPSYIPTDGLVGWWPFNGNANDVSGNGNNGTVNGATLTSDRFANNNKAFSFNGTSDFISINHNEALNLPGNNNSFSFSAWINPNQTNQQELNILSKGAGGGLNSNDAYIFSVYNQNKIGLQLANFSNAYWTYSNNPISFNQWNHVVVVYDIILNSASFFINGLFAGEQQYSFNPSSNNDAQFLFFGKQGWNCNCNFMDGVIDDIAIWNRALTPDEITALYTTSSTNNETANTSANVPGAISYQAVARDAQGAPLADTNVQVRFTLIANTLSGSEEYVETHTLSTNNLGLFTTAFGAGTPVSNTFDNINWSAGHKFLNVKIDTGNGLVDIGTQQLLSTPYSLYSAKAGEIKNPGLPVFSDNAAALAGGLVAGDMYRTAAGVLMVVY